MPVVSAKSNVPQPNPDCEACNGLGWEPTPQGSKRCNCLRDSIKRIKLAAIPPLFAGLSLETIAPDANRHRSQAALIQAMRDEPYGSFILCGRNGCGKTTFGWLLYRAAVEREQPATGVTCAELMHQFRDWQFSDDKVPSITPDMLRTNERRFLFIDEIDKPKPSEFAAEQLFELIDAAYAYRHQLVITSNTPLDGLAAHWSRNAVTIGASIVRRLMEIDSAILADMF